MTGAYANFIASPAGRKHMSQARRFIDSLPEAEVEQLLIIRATAMPMGEVRRSRLMAELGITTPPPSADPDKPYGERAECDFGPDEVMGQ